MVIPTAAPTRLDEIEADAVRSALDRVLHSRTWVLGPEVERFEAAFAAAQGGGHAVGVGNGSDALAVAFVTLGLEPGDKVLVPCHDGGFAAQAAAAVGLAPVAVDVDPGSGLVTAQTCEAAMLPGVRAVVATHLHGDPLDIGALDAWRRSRGLLLVEDCAQAHGARVDGRPVGSHGDAAMFSFYPTKNLGALGDAGAVVLRDPAAADVARSLREYGWGERFRVEHARGRNSRLDEVQAGVLMARLPHLERRNAHRRSIAQQYRTALDGSGAALVNDLTGGVVHHALVVTDERDALAKHLHDAGIATAVHYPHLIGEMRGLGNVPGVTPAADARRHRILTLPCFPELTEAEVGAILDSLEKWRERVP